MPTRALLLRARLVSWTAIAGVPVVKDYLMSRSECAAVEVSLASRGAVMRAASCARFSASRRR